MLSSLQTNAERFYSPEPRGMTAAAPVPWATGAAVVPYLRRRPSTNGTGRARRERVVTIADGKASPAPVRPARPARRRGKPASLRRGEGLFGWLFISPALAILLLFLVIPIILALYISFTNWSGLTNPLSSSVKWVGLANYQTIITRSGLDSARLRHFCP